MTIKATSSLKKQFLNRAAYNGGGIILFSQEIILEIIEQCRKENLKILGLEGFYILENYEGSGKTYIQPDMEYDTDFDDLTKDETYIESINFVNRLKDKPLFIEIYISLN